MPELQAFYNESKNMINLVGVDIGMFTGLGTTGDAQNLLRDLDITYPAGFVSSGEPLEQFEIIAMPTTIFITADGQIFRKWSGAVTQEILTSILQEMLQ